MTKQDLLAASIKEFQDNKNNAVFWDCKRVVTKSGYCYIIKQKSRNISCAIHYNRSFETDEAIGKYENNDFTINTREELDYHGLLEYKGMHFAIASAGNYNETMAQYHYQGSGAFKPISDKFLIVDEAEIDNSLGIDSVPIFMSFGEMLEIPVLPAYFEATYFHAEYILVSVDFNASLTPISYSQGMLEQRKVDNITLTFVNFNAERAMDVLKKLQDFSVGPDTTFGFLTLPDLKERTIHQKSFDWKALSYTSEFQINYVLQAKSYENQAIIKQVFFKMLEAL